MSDKMENVLAFQRQALRVHNQRQQLIASNIANADTPHYKAKDLDFRAALNAVREGKGERTSLKRTHPAHREGGGGVSSLDPFTGYRTELQSSVDGNTVDMDQERAAFAETTLYYESSLNFINRLLRGMRTAITGQ
ncbi:flagellar basal body rod protein FlgB [Hydrogenophilus islandicus]